VCLKSGEHVLSEENREKTKPKSMGVGRDECATFGGKNKSPLSKMEDRYKVELKTRLSGEGKGEESAWEKTILGELRSQGEYDETFYPMDIIAETEFRMRLFGRQEDREKKEKVRLAQEESR